ncbi:Adenylate kinase isoenzyme 6-like protein [Smittium mucronatum]|uniref:Adenylate kinase isoenzyme 6 homolog n=1 Tax=Smittium mucronatum TaxID=133383 RepID=A0A1R0GSY4_9FUNG|nr:Adenylate kinase isoenzyme 6-like protein [Smittium mucronatum]
MDSTKRSKPNVLITGTPGTGKTTTSEMVSDLSSYTLINVSEIIKKHNLHDGYDEEFDTYWLNIDKLIDFLEDQVSGGGCIVDYHSCDIFPERWFDLVVVLRTSTENLYDRLVARNYNQKKINENMECEIMQVVLEEAREGYNPDIVVELTSDNVQEIEDNVLYVQDWILKNEKSQLN